MRRLRIAPRSCRWFGAEAPRPARSNLPTANHPMLRSKGAIEPFSWRFDVPGGCTFRTVSRFPLKRLRARIHQRRRPTFLLIKRQGAVDTELVRQLLLPECLLELLDRGRYRQLARPP